MNISELKKTKEFWYFVGYFWADGYINRDKYCQMEIIKTDAIELQNIICNIIDYSVTERQRDNRQKQSCFYINNKELLHFFVDNGKYSNTVESHQKIFQQMPEGYDVYFLRGLIDGDGCYSKVFDKRSNTVSIQFNISGRFEQDWDYLKIVLQKFGLTTRVKRRTHKNSKSSILLCTDTDKICDFYNLLYSNNDGVYLTRKKDKLESMIQESRELRKHNRMKRGYYMITIGENTPEYTYNLREFCKNKGLCYENCSKLSTGYIKKYKNIKIQHKDGLIPNNL